MSEPDFSIPDRGDTGQRVLIGLGGLLLLALGTVITLGGALIGLVVVGITWLVKRGGPRPLSRGLAWFISVGATIVPLLAFMLISALSVPTRTPEQVKRDMAEARARQRTSTPAILQKLMKNQPQAGPATDSLTDKLLTNRGFMFWFAAMGAVIGSSLLGAYAGTIGWLVAMIFFRAFAGEWMGTRPVIPPPTVSF